MAATICRVSEKPTIVISKPIEESAAELRNRGHCNMTVQWYSGSFLISMNGRRECSVVFSRGPPAWRITGVAGRAFVLRAD